MVASVFRPPRARTSGGLLPLPQEWERWRNRLDHEAPPDHPTRSSLNLPCDWHSVDRLIDDYNLVLAEKQAPPVQDAATSRLQDEMRALKERYHQAWCDFKEAKKEVRKIAGSRSQALMQILPVGWDKEFPPISLSVSDAVIFSSYQQAKTAIDEFMVEVLFIENRLHSLDEALGFANESEGAQARYMVLKLFERVECLENELRELKSKQSNKRAA